MNLHEKELIITSSNSEIILNAENITKKFGGMTAVNNVSFSLRKNEIVGLIGANGAGKTTLFNVLTGNYIPEAGKVFYKGEDITKLPPERRVSLGIVRTFQLASTFDSLSVLDNLRLAYFKSHCSSSLIKTFFSKTDKIVSEKIDQCLDTFDLTKSATRRTENISLGEKRILEIAMALITDPELLLLDEPFAGLNDAEIDEVLAILRKHTQAQTILIVEHKISKIQNLVERLGVMVEGVMIAEGETNAVLNDPRVRKEYWHTA